MVKQKKSREPVIVEEQPTLVNGNKNVLKNVTPNKMDTKPSMNGVAKKERKTPKLTLNEALDKLEPKVEEEPAAGGGSMAILLTQGIMANDPVKIDSVLRTTNIDVIRATLKDIQAMHVVPFLKTIEHRLRTRTAGIIRPWIRWLQCTFSIHMAFLVTQRNLETELGSLLEWMRARVGHQEQLLALHGKVSVISEQIERRLNRGADDVVHQPLIVFNNDDNIDSDLDDMESLGSDESGASSEEDWWDEPGMRDDEDNENDDDDDDEDIDSDEEFSKQVRRTNEEDDSDDDDEDDGGIAALAGVDDTDDEEDDDEENEEEMDVS